MGTWKFISRDLSGMSARHPADIFTDYNVAAGPESVEIRAPDIFTEHSTGAMLCLTCPRGSAIAAIPS